MPTVFQWLTPFQWAPPVSSFYAFGVSGFYAYGVSDFYACGVSGFYACGVSMASPFQWATPVSSFYAFGVSMASPFLRRNELRLYKRLLAACQSFSVDSRAQSIALQKFATCCFPFSLRRNTQLHLP